MRLDSRMNAARRKIGKRPPRPPVELPAPGDSDWYWLLAPTSRQALLAIVNSLPLHAPGDPQPMIDASPNDLRNDMLTALQVWQAIAPNNRAAVLAAVREAQSQADPAARFDDLNLPPDTRDLLPRRWTISKAEYRELADWLEGNYKQLAELTGYLPNVELPIGNHTTTLWNLMLSLHENWQRGPFAPYLLDEAQCVADLRARFGPQLTSVGGTV